MKLFDAGAFIIILFLVFGGYTASKDAPAKLKGETKVHVNQD